MKKAVHNIVFNTVLLVLVSCLSGGGLFAQPVVRQSLNSRVIGVYPQELGSRSPASLVARDPLVEAKRAAGYVAPLFAVQDANRDLSLQNVQDDSLGTTHVRFAQRVDGVPVLGASLSVHLNDRGTVQYIDGNIAPTSPGLSGTPNLSAEEAVVRANVDWATRFGTHGRLQGKPRLYFLDESLLSGNSSTPLKLIWLVELYDRTPSVQHEKLLVDAGDGVIHKRLSVRSHAIRRLVLDCTPGSPCFADLPAQNGQYVFGRSEGQPARGVHPFFGSLDTDNVYSQLGLIHNYYEQRLGRNGANLQGGIGDGANAKVDLTAAFVHFNVVSNDCPNAFFDGFSLNFCNGLVTLDVTAHEYQHAVTAYAVKEADGTPTGLIYQGESGALNESYSDIFGELVELRVTGSNDFLAGAGINAPPLIGALRSFSNPPDFFQPDRFHSELVECGTADNGGVHTNSGVLNKAVFLLMQGGTFNGCTIGAIGADATEAIFYRALTTYLTPTSNFNFAYQALVQSCNDLGLGTTVCGEVTKALQAVEMNQPGTCSGQNPVAAQCNAGAPPPPISATPLPVDNTAPANLLIESRLKRRTTRSAVHLVSGIVLNASSSPLSGTAVRIVCTNKGREISGNLTSDGAGQYSATVVARQSGMLTCLASSGNAVSQRLKLVGPKMWRRARGGRQAK